MSNDRTQRARYLVELAAPDGGWEEIERMMRRVRASADGAAGGARLVRSIFVPEDGRCYLLYEAGSAEQARRAAARAELAVAGTAEAIHTHEEVES
jgi:hypothetical protein